LGKRRVQDEIQMQSSSSGPNPIDGDRSYAQNIYQEPDNGWESSPIVTLEEQQRAAHDKLAFNEKIFSFIAAPPQQVCSSHPINSIIVQEQSAIGEGWDMSESQTSQQGLEAKEIHEPPNNSSTVTGGAAFSPEQAASFPRIIDKNGKEAGMLQVEKTREDAKTFEESTINHRTLNRKNSNSLELPREAGAPVAEAAGSSKLQDVSPFPTSPETRVVDAIYGAESMPLSSGSHAKIAEQLNQSTVVIADQIETVDKPSCVESSEPHTMK
jgi:hypothetical protein